MSAVSRRPLVYVALGLALGGGAFAVVRARGPRVPTVIAATRDLEQHVVASGRVWVPTRVQIAAQTQGLVLSVGASEGQRVAPGDLLVQLEDSAERAAVAQADAAVEQARARVEQLRKVGAIVATEGLKQAESNLARADAELTRARRLASTGALADAALEAAERAVEIARAQKNAAEAQQLAAAPLGADSRVGLTALLQAEAQLAGARVRLGQTRITARVAGSVLTRAVEPGDVVQPARTLLVIAADAEPQLVFHADERNLAWLALGQRAKVSADAFPQQLFDAELSYIAPSIDAERGSVEVRLRAIGPPDTLKPDMTVSIDLTVASRQRVLTVPSEAVRGAASARPYVLAVVDGRATKVDVGLGIRGQGHTEIGSGLREGAELIVPDGQRIEPGAAVRAEPR